MDYIKQDTLFEKWCENNYLPIFAYVIWRKLFKRFNRGGWCEWVTVDNLTLMAESQIRSEKSLILYRDKLIAEGLIEYQKGTKGSPNRYKMTDLTEIYCTKYSENDIANDSKQKCTVLNTVQTTVESAVESAVINKTKTKTKTKENKNPTDSSSASSADYDRIMAEWNSLGLVKIQIIQGKRGEILNARIKQYGIDKVSEALENIRKSAFLCGQSRKGWTINFDWFIKPNNFPKVLEGNYTDKIISDNAENLSNCADGNYYG